MLLIGIIVFFIISIISLINFCTLHVFYKKMIMFFYFGNNFMTFMLLYFLFSNKFGFILNMIIPLMVLNMILVLLFVKTINNYE